MAVTDVMEYPPPTEEERAFYDENGYLIIPNAIEPIGIERLRAGFENRESELRPDWEESVREGTFKGGYGNGPNAHTMSPDFNTDTALLDIANNPKILPYVENITGPDYQVMEMLYHNHHAGAAAHTGWHRDWPPWSHPQFTLKIKVFYFVDDQDEDMGCFSLVPGTQRNPEGPPKEQYKGEDLETMPNMKKMAFKAGDAILWNVCCWHTGCANITDRDRRLAIFGYMPFFVKKYVSKAPAESVITWADTPMKRQLMGIHCVHGRRGWDRADIPYLPEHEEIAMKKKL